MGRCLSHPASQSGRKKRQKEIKLAAEVTRLFIHKVRRAALDKPAKVLLCWDILEAEQKLDYVVGVRTDGARGDFPSLLSHMNVTLNEKASSADTATRAFISGASSR